MIYLLDHEIYNIHDQDEENMIEIKTSSPRKTQTKTRVNTEITHQLETVSRSSQIATPSAEISQPPLPSIEEAFEFSFAQDDVKQESEDYTTKEELNMLLEAN